MKADPPSPRCGRCGAPTRTQDVKGLEAQVCVSCGAVTVDQSAFEQLAGPAAPAGRAGRAAPPEAGRRDEPSLPDGLVGRRSDAALASAPDPARSEDTFDRELSALQDGGRQRTVAIAVVGALALGVVVLAVPVGYGLYAAATWVSTPAPLSATTAPATGGGLVVVESDAVVPEPSEGSPEQAAAPAVVGDPSGHAPAEVPAAPAPPSATSLVKRGWDQVETDPAAAAASFRSALELRPDHADANYGFGYATLKLGDHAGARPFLCKALQGGNVEVTRDVRSILAQNTLTCD